jgi:tetratricopeptide (TPR) repeat protein
MNNNFKKLYLFGVGIALVIGLHLLVISNVIKLLGIVFTVAVVLLEIVLAFSLYSPLADYFNNKEATVYFKRGLARYQQGDNQGAIENYNQVLRLNPNLTNA